MPDSPTSAVSLRIVDEDNVKAVMDLAVAESQTGFVAPNVVSLAQAFAAKNAWVRAVYAAEEPVGFVMLSDDEVKPRYYLWRFMIDARFQGRGYGTAAMALVEGYVRTRPNGNKLYLSYVPEDGGPGPFYHALGFVDTGVVHGDEVESVKVLI